MTDLDRQRRGARPDQEIERVAQRGFGRNRRAGSRPGLGGVAGPALFGALIEGGARDNIMWGYMLGAALMLIAAATEWKLGFAAERRSLEDVATPLSRAAE